MQLPIIGITSSRRIWKNGASIIAVNESYTKAVLAAGGVPVVVPLGLPDASLKAMASHLDGFLFTGGGDVHPHFYDGNDHQEVSDVDEDRDRVELQLFKHVYENARPFLGICRGLQLINVAMGGTLYEHVLDQHPGAIQHSYSVDHERSYLAHPVRVEPESNLAKILGESDIRVNSLHHQGIRELAPGVSPLAYASDGLVEAIEVPGVPFGLAVQWHPEELQMDPAMCALFTSLVKAAEGRS